MTTAVELVKAASACVLVPPPFLVVSHSLLAPSCAVLW